MDLLKITKSLKPVKGQRLTAWLQRFLIAPPDQLAQWHGTFTEVTTAKVVEIYRRRGVVEEHEVNQSRFGLLVNAAYRAPVFTAKAETPKSEKTEGEVFREYVETQTPDLGELLRGEMDRIERTRFEDGSEGPEVIVIPPRNP